ncbi:MAG TPA: hypothetical protein VK459_19665 [Polyangiaceae bacterium]|jgi:hypothetical protein|nr:hypothetical protein [Polyangiaceae bacterium]
MADDQDLDGEDDEKGEGDRKRLFERAIPEAFKRVIERMVERAVERGVGKLADGPESIRHFMGEMKLPKEVLAYLYTQLDDTKGDLYRVVAKEVRDVFERMQFADEIAKVLTKLSFEIRTEIRFIPNDAGQGASPRAGEGEGGEGEALKGEGEASKGTGLPKPEVSTQVTVKDRSKDARPIRRRREDT